MFLITFGVAMIRTTIYSIWASAESQPFNNPKVILPNESAELMESVLQKPEDQLNA